MFAQKIIELAQAATSTNINQNLQNTEEQLQNLNANLDLLKEEYNAVASQPTNYSFFDLSNIYFWFVLAGLLLLAFGLLFLLAELQNKERKNRVKPELPKLEPLTYIQSSAEDKAGEKVEAIKFAPQQEIPEKKIEPKIAFKPVEKTEAKIKAKKPVLAPAKESKKGPIKIKVEKVK
ncbi:MAG: hypothetical protein WC465_00425 [Patescibacteria group bacterium]